MIDKDYNYKEINKERKSGIILHISSLAQEYGIGTFGKKAYEFCDYIKEAGFHYWQILPLGPTGYGDSPYQSYSSFAGNPYFIDLETLINERLLLKEEIKNIDFGSDKLRVDYGKLYNNRINILKKAYERFKEIDKLEKFVLDNKEWLVDYALFMALKKEFNNSAWYEWEEKIKNRDENEIAKYTKLLHNEIYFNYFLQYQFYNQYNRLKEYINNKNIKLIGDLPIYCALDSADVWVDRKQFNLELIGGCPPFGPEDDGQLWGNPTYNWEYMKNDKFSWWETRIIKTLKLFDILRIDHFRGFESFWAVPVGKKASKGSWIKAYGQELFDMLNNKYGKLPIIAEDLGYMTKEVTEFRNKTGYYGMKVLQFAFNENDESDYLPHNIERHWTAYASTHDSDTVKGWIDSTYDLEFAKRYLGLNHEEGYVWGFLRGVWSSVANIAIAQVQDFLELDNNYRMNVPSTLGNWNYRLDESLLTDELKDKLYKFNKTYSRLNK